MTLHRRSALLSTLERFEPADDSEADYLDRMRALLAVDGDPFARDHFAPGHFTASSFILSPDMKRILLIFHSKLELWLQPGGHVDPEDEDIFESARREVEEETGLVGLDWFPPGVGPTLFDLDIHEIPARKSDPAHEHFDVRVLFVARSEEIVAGSDAIDARWVPIDAFSSIHTDESVMRAVRKIRGLMAAR